MIRRTPGRLSAARGFTLVEIMIVVAIIGVILSIAVPAWMRQRERARQRACQENLSKIQGAKEQWAMENQIPDSGVPSWDDLVQPGGTGYLKAQPHCPAGGDYTIGSVGVAAICSILIPLDHNASN